MGRKNNVGKGEIACNEQFLLFPVFSKDIFCRHVKTRACLGNSLRRVEYVAGKGPEHVC